MSQKRDNSDCSSENHEEEPPNKKRKSSYDEADLHAALLEIADGASIYATSRKFNIPESTLSRRRASPDVKKPGRTLALSTETENKLVSWIKFCGRRGDPKSRRDIMTAASELMGCEENCSSSQLTDGWFQRFMIRHPDLSSRTPQSVTRASSVVSEADIRKFHAVIYDWLEEESLLHLLNMPDHWINSDETGFELNPKPKKTIVEKGQKTVSIVESSNPSQKVSAMFTFGADGTSYTPQLIYKKGLRKLPEIYRECRRKFPFCS